MNTIQIYVTDDRTGTVHLMDDDSCTSRGCWATRCGRPAGGMPMGDETLSGHAATCNRCRRIVGLPKAGGKD